jgi:NADH:ubiquinone oxidoreductase subunit E
LEQEIGISVNEWYGYNLNRKMVSPKKQGMQQIEVCLVMYCDFVVFRGEIKYTKRYLLS